MSIDLGQAEKQKSERYRPPEMPADPIEAFRNAMLEYGLTPKDGIEADGKLHRFDVDKRGDMIGWYVFFAGEICGGAFGNWKTDLKEIWGSKGRHEMTDAESAEYQRIIAEAKRKRKEEEAINHARAKERANLIWNSIGPAPDDHPYLAKKNVPAHGLKVSRGNLVVPLMDEKGEIWNLQFIKPEKPASGRDKVFLTGGRVDGLSYTITGDSPLMIGEGFATMASVHDATGATCIVSFNAGNLPKVARVVRECCKADPITICADNDRFTAGNPGLTYGDKAAKEISAKLVLPNFEGLPGGNDPKLKYSDFNDLHKLAGIDAVKTQIQTPGQRARLPPLTAAGSQVKGRLKARPAPLEFIFRYNDQGLIPRGVVGVLTATGGTGKTFFLLSLALAGAKAGNFGPINAPKLLSTLVIVAEDSQDELDRRLWDIARGQFPDNLHAASVYGEIGPLMRLEGSMPTLADAYYWLEETIAGHPGLDLLILDPKSRLYGLDENNNDHATQWIQALEGLSKRHDLTILFSQHTSKQEGGRISQNMGRGASAIVDGCRWSAGLVRMDQETAARLGVENPRQYVLFDAPKSNYAADLPGTIIFKRGKNGVLEYDEPGESHKVNMAEYLIELLLNDPVEYTARQLISRKEGKGIADEMIGRFPGFKRGRDMGLAIDHLLKTKQLTEEPGIRSGTILKPVTPF